MTEGDLLFCKLQQRSMIDRRRMSPFLSNKT